MKLDAPDSRTKPADRRGSALPGHALIEPGNDRPARVLAVIVSHDPDRDALTSVLESLAASGASVLVVDNSESESGCARVQAIAAAHGAEALCNPRNLGVAEAQNIGLRLARERGFTHVLLLDQDSVLEADTVAQLVGAFHALRRAGQPVAAVGASFVDPRSGYRYPFVRLRHVRMGRIWPQPGETRGPPTAGFDCHGSFLNALRYCDKAFV